MAEAEYRGRHFGDGRVGVVEERVACWLVYVSI